MIESNLQEDLEIESPIEIQPIESKEEREIIEDFEVRREDTRSGLAQQLMWLLIGTYLATFGTMLVILFLNQSPELQTERFSYSKDIFSLLITTQVGLFGAVIGFYFGSSSRTK